jgi:ABC-2 type transport system permease protein
VSSSGLSDASAPAVALSDPIGQPIRGPRALDESWSRFWHLTYNIARSEFKLKFFGSALGYLWQVVRPLLLFGVLYVFFVEVFHVDRAKAAAGHVYGAQLLGSIVLYTFFAEATSGAVRSVVDRENLVRKIQFPRLAIPASVTLLAAFNLALNLVVVMIFAVIAGVRPMFSWFELPLIVAMLALLAAGVAMLLSALFVRFRDISPIWEVFSQVLFYASPVILPAEAVRSELGTGHVNHILYHVYTLNPLVTIFQQFRHAMINPSTLSAGQIMGSWLALLEPIALVVIVFVLGFWVFNREAPHIAEDL